MWHASSSLENRKKNEKWTSTQRKKAFCLWCKPLRRDMTALHRNTHSHAAGNVTGDEPERVQRRVTSVICMVLSGSRCFWNAYLKLYYSFIHLFIIYVQKIKLKTLTSLPCTVMVNSQQTRSIISINLETCPATGRIFCRSLSSVLTSTNPWAEMCVSLAAKCSSASC